MMICLSQSIIGQRKGFNLYTPGSAHGDMWKVSIEKSTVHEGNPSVKVSELRVTM